MITAFHFKFVKSFFLMAALISCYSAIAQIKQPWRYEREQKNADDYFYIISLKDDGLALFRQREKYKQNNKIWELVFLDSTLRDKKTLELEIRERLDMVGYEVAPGHIYFLFRSGETTRNEFHLIDVGFNGEELGRYRVKPDLDFRLTHFIKAGNSFVFGGYVSNEAVVILYDPATNNLKVVPGFFQKDTELVDVRSNQNGTFNTVLIDRSNRGERKLLFKIFDETGKQLLDDNVVIDEDVSLQTGITSTLEREELLIAGTWGDKNSKQSHGFYTLPIDPFSADKKIQYIDFGRLNQFVNFLPEKRAQRIKEIAKENEGTGRKSSFTSYVMPFKLQENKDGFYLLAEVYNPVNSNSFQHNSPYYYNPYFSPYGYNPFWSGFYYPGMSRMYRPYLYGPNPRTSDEVRTVETVLILIDGNGKIKWDESFKLEEVRLPALEQVGDFVRAGDQLYIVYKKESDIRIKTVDLTTGERTETTEKIQTASAQDVIRSEKETEGGVRYWFGNSFYVWGYQTLRNASKEDRVRDVFYINRVDP